MSALSIQPTYPIFTDIDGQPLEAGYVWIGTANLDPQTNPINVYWDAALTILAPQPIRTLAGYPSRNGTPARLYVNSDYSIRVMNKNGSVVYSAPAATERYSDVVIADIDSSKVTFIQAGTGAVSRTAQSKMRESVNVLDFGAIMDDPLSRTVNKTALVNAMNTGKKINVPAGVLWIDNDIEFVTDTYLCGEGALLTTIKGSGDLFKVTTGFGAGTFQGLTLENDATLGKLYTLTPPNDAGHARFIDVNFGDATYHIFHATGFAAVNPIFENCVFRGATINSRYYRSLWAYKETNCYNWYNAAGLVVEGTSMGASINNSVFEHHTNEAIKLSVNSSGAEQLAFSINNTYFEFNGKAGTPDVTLVTSAAGRIRALDFNNCIIQNPDVGTTPVRVQISAGGGGNIDQVVFSSCAVIGSIPLVTDSSAATLRNTYVAAGTSSYVNVRIPNLSEGAIGQVAPRSTPSVAWNTDFTQDSISIANGATYDLAVGSGLISFIAVGSVGTAAGVVLCAFGTTTLVATTLASVTVTPGTANKLNVFYNAGTGRYRLENLLGNDVAVSISMNKLRSTV